MRPLDRCGEPASAVLRPVEGGIDTLEPRALAPVRIDEDQPRIGQLGLIEGVQNASRTDDELEQRSDGSGNGRRPVGVPRHRRGRFLRGLPSDGGRLRGTILLRPLDGREGERAIPIDQNPQLQVAHLDGLGLEIGCQERRQVHAQDGIGRAEHEVASRSADVEAVRPEGRRSVMQLDGGIPQRHVPAGPDAGRQRLRDPLRQTPEAHGSGRQAQIKEPERRCHEDDQPKLHIQGPRSTRLRRLRLAGSRRDNVVRKGSFILVMSRDPVLAHGRGLGNQRMTLAVSEPPATVSPSVVHTGGFQTVHSAKRKAFHVP